MAKKQLVRLTESDLNNIIKESVNIILNEIGDTHRGQYMLGRLSNRQHHDYGKFAPRNGEYNSALTTAINAKRPHYKDFNQGYEHEEKLGKKIDNPKGDDEFFDFIYQGKKDRDIKEN